MNLPIFTVSKVNIKESTVFLCIIKGDVNTKIKNTITLVFPHKYETLPYMSDKTRTALVCEKLQNTDERIQNSK